ncbi:MAG: hypothetical protein ACI93T_000699, partial [Porticoccaceae bacterium]
MERIIDASEEEVRAEWHCRFGSKGLRHAAASSSA